MPRADVIADTRYAADLAQGAGAAIVRLRAEPDHGSLTDVERKALGDATGQAYLNDRLRAERPDDAILSEEAADSAARLDSHRVWIIDPLDGTREFAEGRDDWAVHVALWNDGELVAGAVALPGIGTVLASDDPPVSFAQPERIRLAVSRSRPPALVDYLAEALDAELVPMGSAGYKVSAVVRGAADAYVHAGGQYEWDSAAPVAVARNAGLFTSRIDGAPLEYNQANPYLPDLVVCNPGIADLILSTIRRYEEENA
ncbi:3'(2'),5'-bisphosphate nucleotidase CysQ [Diaminobutyricibacter sp. McL0608]|uniref:3'(2'),5'-bisphosphate nucleotidase CysQ n=1 Tax=Leifsonia sp. McL0608 TaxID=3143537 RepID=UPI0031F2E18D